jgi:hypothetical protein
VEAPLIGEAQAGPCVEARHRGALGEGDAREPDLMAGLELAAKIVEVAAGGDVEIAVEALEVARDALLARHLLDPVHRRGVGAVDLGCLVEAAHADHLVVVVVEVGGEVAGGAGGHATADRPAVEHDDGTAFPGELVGDRQAGQARPDHDEVSLGVGAERGRVRHLGVPAPHRQAVLVTRIHA